MYLNKAALLAIVQIILLMTNDSYATMPQPRTSHNKQVKVNLRKAKRNAEKNRKVDVPTPKTVRAPRKPNLKGVRFANEPTAVKHEPIAVKHEPIAVKHEPTAVKHKPNAVKHEPTAVKHEPTAVSHELSVVNQEPSAANKEHSAANLEQSVTNLKKTENQVYIRNPAPDKKPEASPKRSRWGFKTSRNKKSTQSSSSGKLGTAIGGMALGGLAVGGLLMADPALGQSISNAINSAGASVTGAINPSPSPAPPQSPIPAPLATNGGAPAPESTPTVILLPTPSASPITANPAH